MVEGDFDFQRLYEVTKVVTRNLNKAVFSVMASASLFFGEQGWVWNPYYYIDMFFFGPLGGNLKLGLES